MPRLADSPLRKTTLNLYDADVSFLAEYYGHGWSEEVRKIIHRHCVTTKAYQQKTLGDLE